MAVSTPAGPRGLYPDQTFIASEVLPDALIYQLATMAGSIEGDAPVVRVPYVAEDPTVGFVREGDEIGVTDPKMDEVLVRTAKLAHITRQTNESAAYADASNMLAASMSRAMTVKANRAFLGNAGTPAVDLEDRAAAFEPVGLLNTPGLTESDTYALWIQDDASGRLDSIVNMMATVEANGGTPTHITTDPQTWAWLATRTTSAESNVPLLGAPGQQTARQLFGLPVIVTNAMSKRGLLITDRSNIVAADSALQLATSSEHFFGSDSLARRATWRLGWNMVHVDRTAFLEVSTATA